ncbi:MAG: hypothetical protein C7B46_01290 [Sulfobacillus benefaciens]|uniref:EamA domain-containing protein n=1 Tax=Sulfobacillus benefaciens TaxID=453960 RepID=A0A2T2XLG6_9FIRM|nr:MAG: hypothetical protein C7B46_01290 [Sulfobacillus benefaciens]
MVWWIITRLGLLSGERVAFHGLGKNRSALATMVVAYGGASIVLWLAAVVMGTARFVPATFWSGGVYALSFGLYTTALSKGEVGQVSAWANATPVLLFLWHPTGTIWAWLSVMGFLGGALWLGGIGKRINRGVVLMLLSDLILVLGRLLDVGHVGIEPLAYAASLYLVVTLWMVLASILFGKMTSVWQLLRERPIWALASAVSNGGSYLTLFMLLGMMPVTLIEAVSALAGIGATVVGVFGFHERGRRRKIVAATVMTLATILLLYDHRGILRVQ